MMPLSLSPFAPPSPLFPFRPPVPRSPFPWMHSLRKKMYQGIGQVETGKTLADGFDDASMDTALWQEALNGVTSSTVEEGGFFKCLSVGAIGNRAGLATLIPHDCSDADIYVEVAANVGAAALLQVTQSVALDFFANDHDWFHIGKFSDTNYAVQKCVSGAISWSLALATNNGQTGNLRLKISGGNVTAYEDGIKRYSGNFDLAPGNLYVLCFADEDGTISFDNFASTLRIGG